MTDKNITYYVNKRNITFMFLRVKSVISKIIISKVLIRVFLPGKPFQSGALTIKYYGSVIYGKWLGYEVS
jgi:hypothetical protein